LAENAAWDYKIQTFDSARGIEMKKLFIPYFIFVAIFVLLSSIAKTAYEHGYLHLNLLFYAEKALLGMEGDPPRLENIGFVYPPFSFLPFLFVSDYIIAPSLVSAILLTLFILFMQKRNQDSGIYFLSAFLLLNPLVLFLSIYRFETLLFYLLLTFSVIILISYLKEGFSIYLFLSGILFGLCFFLDFRSLFLIPIFAWIVYISTREREISYRLAILIVKLSPIIFFLLAWLYLNWIFTDSPFTFILSSYSFFTYFTYGAVETLAESKSIFGAIKYTTMQLIYYFPMILPYFLVLFNLKSYKLLYLMPVYMIYLSPVILVLLSVYFSIFFPAYYYTVLFLMFALAFQVICDTKVPKSLIFTLVLSLMCSWVQTLGSEEENEKNFTRFLLAGSVTANLTEYSKVTKILKEENCQKILIDDISGFPIVTFLEDPKRFYLPYMYEYNTVLSYPKSFADCVVVDRSNPRDKILMRFPSSGKGFLKGYLLIYEGEKYNVFRKD
jgi:hypothetical protein